MVRPFIYSPPLSPCLTVIHVDDELLILSKPSGLLTVPGKAVEHSDCLEQRAQKDYPGALIVHRLDMDTSGIIIMARNKSVLAHLGKQFEKRTVHKKYIANVWGHLEQKNGEIDLPLICDWPNRPRQKVDHEHGRPAKTVWDVIDYKENYTRVRLTPITGRSHQLRVHMLSLGHPILGDNIYAHDEAYKASERLQLHAERITIYHPKTGERVEFLAE